MNMSNLTEMDLKFHAFHNDGAIRSFISYGRCNCAVIKRNHGEAHQYVEYKIVNNIN